MKIQISNKNKVNNHIKGLTDSTALILIDNPYPDPLDLSEVVRLFHFRALLKLHFLDCDDKTNHDLNLIFRIEMKESIIHFVESIISANIENCVIACEKGLHRSVAVALGIQLVFQSKGRDIPIIELPQPAQPNTYVLSFFKEYNGS